MKKSLLFLLLVAGVVSSHAGTVDTVSIYSAAMRKSIRCVVIKPDSYKNAKARFPTVYLLHGHGGAYNNWINRVPDLKAHADTYQMIIVCPDGAVNSWYFDSPADTTMKYESFVALEVPAFIESKYRTIKDRRARAITGLSMGGHGGLFLGFRHTDFFGACGSMSGALVIEQITGKQFGMEQRLGDTTNKQRYRDYSIIGEMDKYGKDSLAIIIDCGTEDFIVEMSRAVHRKMLSLKIPHDYTERPGKHDWSYWRTAVEFQLLFFRNYFDQHAAGSTVAAGTVR
jgi:S-formylglutathione hydrolase FrmB